MNVFRPVTAAGKRAFDVVVACPEQVTLVLDYDGVVAPAPQPDVESHAEPGAREALSALARRLQSVVILSARDAATVVRCVDLEPGSGVNVLGQHGLQRWDSSDGTVTSPPPPAAFADIARELPWVLRDCGHPAHFEQRGSTLVVAVHALPDADAAAAAMRQPITELAHRHGLDAELTHQGWEIRPARADKGRALRDLALRNGAQIVVYGGDNRADLPVFESVDDLRRAGVAVIVLYAGDDADTMLVNLSDVYCAGSAGVVAWLQALAARLGVAVTPGRVSG